jgi:hypothetical protein
MLIVLDISNIPKNYSGFHKIISHTPGATRFQYIPFTLANFITESEENNLHTWLTRQNLNATSQFIHNNTTTIDHWTDYWEIRFTCNTVFEFAIQNSSFTDLITEIKNFIATCCYYNMTNEEAIAQLKKIFPSNDLYNTAIKKAIAALERSFEPSAGAAWSLKDTKKAFENGADYVYCTWAEAQKFKKVSSVKEAIEFYTDGRFRTSCTDPEEIDHNRKSQY